MKKSMHLLLALCAAAHLFGQDILPNSNLNDIETIPCPFDPSVTIEAYKGWLIYQTLDGTWDGPIDSTKCLGLVPGSPFDGISLENADLSRPIFMRYKLYDDYKFLLEKNFLYDANTWQWNTDIELKTGMDCPGNLCSGLIVGIEIPDSTGMGTFIRWHVDVAAQNNNYDALARFYTCIPTEYFDTTYLRHFIIKMTPSENMSTNDPIDFAGVDFHPFNEGNQIKEVIAPASTFNGSSYDVHPWTLNLETYAWGSNYLLLYTDTTSWPSAANISYVEARPEVNTPDPQTINLLMDYSTFVVQPFAALRGALVEGDDSIRHTVNLINDGGDICMSGITDFVFGSTSNYIHQGGHVDFGHRSACFMFQDGGDLEVADNATFYYGHDGKGIMALRPGSTIRLGKGSTLHIDNTLWLQGIPTGQFPDHQLYMELNEGSTLSFGKNARVLNAMSISPDTKLNVYMNGGTLDDSRLRPGDRQLIRRIYPQPKDRFSENVRLRQNPVSDLLRLSYLSGREGELSVEVYDLQGRPLGHSVHRVLPGKNEIHHDLEGMPVGIYLAKVKGEEGEAVLKFIKG